MKWPGSYKLACVVAKVSTQESSTNSFALKNLDTRSIIHFMGFFTGLSSTFFPTRQLAHKTIVNLEVHAKYCSSGLSARGGSLKCFHGLRSLPTEQLPRDAADRKKVNGHLFNRCVRCTECGRCSFIVLGCTKIVKCKVLYLKRMLQLYTLVLLDLRPALTETFLGTVSCFHLSRTESHVPESELQNRAKHLLMGPLAS